MALWKCVAYFSSAIPTQGLRVQSEFTLLKKYLLYMKVEEYNSLKVEIEVEAVCFWIITLTIQYFHSHWCLLFKQKQVITRTMVCPSTHNLHEARKKLFDPNIAKPPPRTAGNAIFQTSASCSTQQQMATQYPGIRLTVKQCLDFIQLF